MSNTERILDGYKNIESRIHAFIIEHSRVEYLEGSNEIVHGGAFSWTRLLGGDSDLQEVLCLDYTELGRKAINVLESATSRHLDDFCRSYESVLSYLRQDSLVWVPSLEQLFQSIKIELDIQQFFVASPHYV
ncbi:hypothetical protein F4V43_14350 [Paenibacillus spiritus]|uniref:Uncharacterized protein n=1 Tax=Paenibacillus spiritus TaxID=2496557 RepID=A0A5J5G2F3_9BACL|nr:MULTISPECIES: hypothetical protein [Paenibacillus]KAA9001019.1 hypothetical protein F4V43_14350 [Paenibacillus spiritus]